MGVVAGFFLITLVVVLSLAFSIRALADYDKERRSMSKTPPYDSTDPALGFMRDAPVVGGAGHSHSPHHADTGCSDGHHGSCDSGFDFGHSAHH
jgi:hypothetical protein